MPPPNRSWAGPGSSSFPSGFWCWCTHVPHSLLPPASCSTPVFQLFDCVNANKTHAQGYATVCLHGRQVYNSESKVGWRHKSVSWALRLVTWAECVFLFIKWGRCAWSMAWPMCLTKLGQTKEWFGRLVNIPVWGPHAENPVLQMALQSRGPRLVQVALSNPAVPVYETNLEKRLNVSTLSFCTTWFSPGCPNLATFCKIKSIPGYSHRDNSRYLSSWEPVTLQGRRQHQRTPLWTLEVPQIIYLTSVHWDSFFVGAPHIKTGQNWPGLVHARATCSMMAECLCLNLN